MTPPDDVPSRPPPSSPSSSSTSSTSPYPYAAAPDVIRAHQKDAYFSGLLTGQVADLHRRLLGARSAHAWAAEGRAAADVLYLGLTTLLGNRTLGEEYCDLVQVVPTAPSTMAMATAMATRDASSSVLPQLPTLARRAAYIAGSVLLPYGLSRVLPRLRAAARRRLEARLADGHRAGKTDTRAYRARRHALAHLGSLTSAAAVAEGPLRAAALAAFYFTGAYYSLSKRALGLRYVFTRHVDAEAGGRAGYEVLGVLLVLQLAVQAYLRVRAALASVAGAGDEEEEEAAVEAAVRERVARAADANLDGNVHSYAEPPPLEGPSRSLVDVGAATHTPVLEGARYDLRKGDTMRWIRGAQQRKCTLCLDPLRDPAATQCGHVFCWSCIGDWVREKPECPLCRREVMIQHILPLRAL